jgi:hypothetical protein
MATTRRVRRNCRGLTRVAAAVVQRLGRAGAVAGEFIGASDLLGGVAFFLDLLAGTPDPRDGLRSAWERPFHRVCRHPANLLPASGPVLAPRKGRPPPEADPAEIRLPRTADGASCRTPA